MISGSRLKTNPKNFKKYELARLKLIIIKNFNFKRLRCQVSKAENCQSIVKQQNVYYFVTVFSIEILTVLNVIKYGLRLFINVDGVF